MTTETVPIAVDRRGLTPAWTRKTSKEEGFTVLWPERCDDTVIRVVPTPTRSAMYSTYFVFQRSMGFAVTVVRYHSGTIMHPVDVPIEEAEALDDVRDRFLSDDHAELLGEARSFLANGLVANSRRASPSPQRTAMSRDVVHPALGSGVSRHGLTSPILECFWST